MIEVHLRTAAGVNVPNTAFSAELIFCNVGPLACFGLTAELRMSSGLLLLHGDRHFEAERVGPGECVEHPLRLRADNQGTMQVVLRHFSYRDAKGLSHNSSGTVVDVVVGSGCSAPHEQGTEQLSVPQPQLMGTGLFVSHRSTDNPLFVAMLTRYLRAVLSPHAVFVDEHDLRVGRPWRTRLDRELQGCGALLALIGPTWSSGSDVLLWEIDVAIQRSIGIVPVLFDGAKMPTALQLPPAIAAFAELQALRIRADTVDYDLSRMQIELRDALGQ